MFIKPCPIHGESCKARIERQGYGLSSCAHFVKADCGTRGDWSLTESPAVTDWNNGERLEEDFAFCQHCQAPIYAGGLWISGDLFCDSECSTDHYRALKD